MSADTEPITIDLDEVRDDIRKVLADHGLTTLDDVCVDVRLFAQDGVEVGVAVSQDDAPAES